jgi:hypothetical protein
MAAIINLITAGFSTIDDAISADYADIGSGTSNYNTFLAVSPTPSRSENEQSINSDDTIDPSAFNARVWWVPTRCKSISHDAQGPP